MSRQATISLFAWLSNATTRDEPIKGGAKTIQQLLNQGANMRGSDSAHRSLVFHLLQLEPKFWNAVLTYCEQQPGKTQLLSDVIVSSLRQTADMFHVAAVRGKAHTIQKILEEVKRLPCNQDIQRALNDVAPVPHNGTPIQIAARSGKDAILKVFLDYTESMTPSVARDAFILSAMATGPGAKPRECMSICCEWLVRNKHDHLNIDQLWPARVFPRDSVALLHACEIVPRHWIDTEKHNTILHFACLQGDVAGVRACIARPDAAELVTAVNLKGQTPLHYALSFGFPECVRLLLDAAAEPDTVDSYSNTPLNQAVYVINTTGGSPTHDRALTLFAEFSERTRIHTLETLHSSIALFSRDLLREAPIIALLQASKVPRNVVAELMPTEAGSRLIPAMLQRGILSKQDLSFDLVWATLQARLWPADRLRALFGFVDINLVRDDGQGDPTTLLVLAAATTTSSEKEPLVKVLLDLGANVNARDKDGRTALHHAVAANNVYAVRFLLQGGADRDVRDTAKKLPQELVVREPLEQHNSATLILALFSSSSATGPAATPPKQLPQSASVAHRSFASVASTSAPTTRSAFPSPSPPSNPGSFGKDAVTFGKDGEFSFGVKDATISFGMDGIVPTVAAAPFRAPPPSGPSLLSLRVRQQGQHQPPAQPHPQPQPHRTVDLAIHPTPADFSFSPASLSSPLLSRANLRRGSSHEAAMDAYGTVDTADARSLLPGAILADEDDEDDEDDDTDEGNDNTVAFQFGDFGGDGNEDDNDDNVFVLDDAGGDEGNSGSKRRQSIVATINLMSRPRTTSGSESDLNSSRPLSSGAFAFPSSVAAASSSLSIVPSSLPMSIPSASISARRLSTSMSHAIVVGSPVIAPPPANTPVSTATIFVPRPSTSPIGDYLFGAGPRPSTSPIGDYLSFGGVSSSPLLFTAAAAAAAPSSR